MTQEISKENALLIYIEIISEFTSGKTTAVSLYNEETTEAYRFVFDNENSQCLEIHLIPKEENKVEAYVERNIWKNLNEASGSGKWTSHVREVVNNSTHIKGLKQKAATKNN